MQILNRTLLLLLVFYPFCAYASERVIIEIMIKEHKFIPDHIHAPEDKVIVLIVQNQDDVAEEFESIDLKREKLIPSHSKAKIVIGPLKAGEYKFFGEFHNPQPQGMLLVEKEEKH
jgi:hypothetical protein